MTLPRGTMAVLALPLLVAACQPAHTGGPQAGPAAAPPGQSGTTAVAPAALPPESSALGGTLAGGYLGARLGPAFGGKARLEAAEAERRALANDAPERWTDPEADASGEVRLLRDFTDAAGRPCREYRHRIRVGRRSDTGSGIACRAPDGTWALVGG